MLDMIELRSSIEEVRVYRSGAEITRGAEITCGPEGFPTTVAIVGLPLVLEDGSVRVRVEGSQAAGRPVALDARVALDASLGERIDVVPDEQVVRALRQDEAQCAATVTRIQAEIARIESASILARPKAKRGERPGPSPMAARLALGAFVKERTLSLVEERAVAQKALERAAELRVDAEARFARASSSREPKPDELRKAIVVTLAAPNQALLEPGTELGSASDGAIGGRVKLVVTYLVPGATWAPAYTLRVAASDGAKRDAELSMRAVVCQRTGEDWSGVRLSLSTADATRWSELPELKSLRVGRAQTMPTRRGWRPLPPGIDSLFEDFDRASRVIAARHPPAPVPMQMPQGAVTRAGRIEDGAVIQTLAAAEEAFMRAPAMPASYSGLPGSAPAPQAFTPLSIRSSGAPSAGPVGRAGTGAMLAKSRASFGASGGGGGERSRAEAVMDEPIEEPEVELRADNRMLGFGSLRMAGGRDPKRGTLTLLTEREAYLELHVSERTFVHLDLGDVIGRAKSRADEASHATPPARHSVPGPVDGFDYAYDSESPADVPSDGVFHSIPVLTTKTEARMHYVTVPRESRDVFRYAELPSAIDAPLLAGPLEVYVGRDYLLSTDLHTTPPKGKIKLGLGVDLAIKVARNTEFGEQVTGLMRGSLDLRHKIRIEVANNKSDAADIEVRERLPTVREKEEDIKVEVVSVDPRWEAYEQDEAKLQGGHVWRVTIEPGAKRILEAAYVVRIAGKHELVGGNRREMP